MATTGLTEWLYEVMILPNPMPEKMDIKHLMFAPRTTVTPQEKEFYDTVKEQIGSELFESTAKILRMCRNDWDVLRPITQAFLINRMLDSKYQTSTCCIFEYPYCSCDERPNRLCCNKMRDVCEEIHSISRSHDYMSLDRESCIEVECCPACINGDEKEN